MRVVLPLRILLWSLANTAAGAAIGFAIAAFREGSLDWQVIWISILFGNVVGFTAIISAVYLFPRFVDLPAPVQFILQTGTLLGGSVLGTAVGGTMMLAGRAGRRTALPFGTFLAPAAVIALFTAPVVFAWYGRLLMPAG